MPDPRIWCVMLTRDRPEMAARAVRCWQRQTRKSNLLILDAGPSIITALPRCEVHSLIDSDLTIGALRNNANELLRDRADIILHWDDDDYSALWRVEEQVRLLTGFAHQRDAVGYGHMLFYCGSDAPIESQRGEVFVYSNGNPRYCLGTSLCYWYRAWEKIPFPQTSSGEDTRWLLSGISSHSESGVWPRRRDGDEVGPTMIATIHASNASGRIDPTAEEWRRAPEWDAEVRRILEEA